MKPNKNELKDIFLNAMAKRRPDPPPKILSTERAATEFTRRWMTECGFDHKAFATLKEQHRAELDKEFERQRLVDRKSRRSALAHAAVANQARVFQNAALTGAFFPHPSTTLNTPIFLLAEPDPSIVKQSEVVRFNSSAKVRVDRRRSSIDQVTFLYRWRNPNATAVTIDAVTFLSAAGRLSVTEAGSLAGSSIGALKAIAEFEVAVDQPLAVLKSEVRTLAAVSAFSWPFTVDGHSSKTFSEGLQMSVLNSAVPADALVFFKVSVVLESDFNPGRAIADLESGDFGIRSPLVVVVLKGQQQPAAQLD